MFWREVKRFRAFKVDIPEEAGAELEGPPPLCEVVPCDLKISDEEALREFFNGRKVEKITDTIYAESYKLKRIRPSSIIDYEYCPRLFWLQAREGKKFVLARMIRKIIEGRLLHEWYERALAKMDDVIAEYRVEKGDLVGTVDLVLIRNGGLVPVEIKTGEMLEEAHIEQLQIYMEIMDVKQGYLVYRDRVLSVDANPAVMSKIEEMRQTLKSPTPPPAARDCMRCWYKDVCARAMAKQTATSLARTPILLFSRPL
ncbi:MAG: CRISPR-associated protein Cas4 [Thermoproteus sp.]|nr:CRISPR-associated protein Cas4 [Thermoproteus sp.]